MYIDLCDPRSKRSVSETFPWNRYTQTHSLDQDKESLLRVDGKGLR